MSRTTLYDDSGSANTQLTPPAFLGRVVRRRLGQLGWTQSDLTREMQRINHTGRHICRQTIHTYAAGKSVPQSVMLKILADALQIEMFDLLPTDLIRHPASRSQVSPMQVGETMAAAVGAKETLAMSAESGMVRLQVNQLVSPQQAFQIMGMLMPKAA